MTTRKILLASAALALSACVADPAKDAPKATVETPAMAASPAATAMTASTGGAATMTAAKTEALKIDGASSKIGWTASKVTKTHKGGFKTFTGAITLGDAKPEASKVEIEIDAASIFSDSDQLTGHLKSPDFFDVATYPKATFTSTSIVPGGDAGATHTVKGNFTLHGVTKDISFPATITVGDKAVTAKAKFSFNRQDWKIAYKGKADDLIRDDVLMEFDVTAPRS